MQLQDALASCDLNKGEAEEAQQALEIHDTDGVVTKITRPSFVGADLQGYDLQGADLSNADLYGADLRHADLRWANLQGADLREAKLKEADLRVAQMQGADLRWADLRDAQMQGANLREANLQDANLQDAKMQGADLRGADLSLTDLSGANFYNAKNLNTVILTNAFYDMANPPLNLPENIKDKLLALDGESYEKAKELQDAYREALVTNSQDTITAAEKALTEHLEKCREDNAKKAIQQAAPVLGEEAISIVVEKLAGPAVTVTGNSPTTAASPSDQQDLSLDGGNVDPYTQYGYGSR
jgi:uncharacterized protein YjbI with pentapeptide repeats